MISRLRDFAPGRIRLLTAGTWFLFLTLDTGRLLIPLLFWLCTLSPSRRDRLALFGAVGAVHVLSFLGFFLHPVARVDPLAFFLALLMAVAVGYGYTFYRLWPILILPRLPLPGELEAALLLALALVTEWMLETFHISIGVPVYFLSDAAALFPLTIPARVVGPWGAVWLWGLLGLGVLRFRTFWGKTLAGLGGLGLIAAGLNAPPLEVRPAPGTTFLLITPGIIYDAPLVTYLERYDGLLDQVRTSPPPGDTLWIIFPEGSFLGTTLQEGMLDTIRAWMKTWDAKIPRPHGWVWHMVVREEGRIHTRVEVITPRGDTLHYDKRWLFIGGEKYVPLVSWFFGEGRVPGSMDQPGFFLLGKDWVAHLLICNESLDPLLVHSAPTPWGVILAPSQFGWIYFPLFLKAIALRHRLVVNTTGLPLCTIQREGGLGCYLPTPEGIRTVGFITSLGPNLLAVQAPLGRQNLHHRGTQRAFWAVLGMSLLGMLAAYTGRGIRSRISPRI